MKENTALVLGADIGGSHIASAVVDLHRNEIVPRTHFHSELDNKGSQEAILATWAGTIKDSLAAGARILGADPAEVAGIGIAMPGPFDYPKGIGLFQGNDKYECLYGVDVRGQLAGKLGLNGDRLHFFNDAFSFAKGAALHQGVIDKRCVCLTLGTGFGASFLEGRLPLTGGDNVPKNGRLWDLPLEDGIADDHFSTRWFVNRFRELSGHSCKGVREILALDDPATGPLFAEFNEKLGRFLAPHLKKFGAEALLIGGNIAKAHPYFLAELQTYLGERVQIHMVEDTERAIILGSSRLMELDFW